MSTRIATCLPLLFALALLAAPPVRAAQIEGVEFAQTARVAGAELPLRGLGLLRYRVLFKAYVGALYLPAGIPLARVLDDVPKRLELHYFWKIDGADFGPAAEQLLERQLAPAELAPLRARIAELHARYRDVSPGDRYALSYAPGSGTTLALNGAAIAAIPGADFARAYFGIWLASDPLDGAFRDQLLSGAIEAARPGSGSP